MSSKKERFPSSAKCTTVTRLTPTSPALHSLQVTIASEEVSEHKLRRQKFKILNSAPDIFGEKDSEEDVDGNDRFEFSC